MIKKACRFLLRVLSAAVFFAAICLFLFGTGYLRLPSSSPDAISSATAQSVSAGDMNGKYVVLLNRSLHDKKGTTADWQKFFSFDENVPLIMEDIVCKVAETDSEGIEAAQKYQARLPENQMKITREAGVMLLSKAELGRFDVIILSRAAAQAYSAQTLYDMDNVLLIDMG